MTEVKNCTQCGNTSSGGLIPYYGGSLCKPVPKE